VQKFAQALGETPEAALPADQAALDALDRANQANMPALLAAARNDKALANLAVAFTTTKAMTHYHKAADEEWPEGLAVNVVKSLLKKYRPTDTISEVEYIARLEEFKLKKNQDPTELFDHFVEVNTQFGVDDPDEKFLIAMAMRKLPEKFVTAFTTLSTTLGGAADLETFENICENIHRTASKKKDDGDSDDELNLAAFDGKKKGGKGRKGKFKGKSRDRGDRDDDGEKCRHCGRSGHKPDDCWMLEKNKKKRPEWFDEEKYPVKGKNKSESGGEIGAVGRGSGGNDGPELLLSALSFPLTLKLLEDPNIWIADSAATCDSTPHAQGAINMRKGDEDDNGVIFGDGKNNDAVNIFDLPGVITDSSGNELQAVKLLNVRHVPSAMFNLFSTTKRQKAGWSLHGDDEAIWLTKGEHKIVFDIRIETPEGLVFAVNMQRVEAENTPNKAGEINAVGRAKNDSPIKMSIQKAHDLLGHIGETMCRKVAKTLGWEISRGSLDVCVPCTVAKAKQKNINVQSVEKPESDGKTRIYLDISSVVKPDDIKSITKRHCRIMVDEKTQLKFVDFFETKDGMVEPTCEKLKLWAQSGHKVDVIRMDNGGENLLLERRAQSKDWQLGIDFEKTARDTPQQNSLAEVGLATVASRARAMMVRANLPRPIRYRLFKDAYKTAALLDGLAVINIDGKSATRYVHWCGKNPAFAKHLRTWGEAGTVKIKTKTTPKLADRGVQCVFVGYALGHSGDTYRMWDPKTGGVHVTRDVIWLRRMYYQSAETNNHYVTVDNENPMPLEAEEGAGQVQNESSDESSDESSSESESSSSSDESVVKTRSGRAVRAPKRLIDEIGAATLEQLTEPERQYYKRLTELGCASLALVGAGVGGGFTNTQELHVMKYNEAMKTGDKEHWVKAVNEEHDRMVKYEVWKPVNRKDLPKGAKVLSTTWAMKKKSNGKFRARLNARGFEQIDGIHYDEDTKSSPVVNEATILIVLVLMLLAGWYGQIVDVNGAFLNGHFERQHEMYLEVAQGFEKFYGNGVVLLLLRTLYGTKQAALQLWNEQRFVHEEPSASGVRKTCEDLRR
jgi:Reverse transcriptase (RNA-dependent DNA polymerase)